MLQNLPKKIKILGGVAPPMPLVNPSMSKQFFVVSSFSYNTFLSYILSVELVQLVFR